MLNRVGKEVTRLKKPKPPTVSEASRVRREKYLQRLNDGLRKRGG